jgi:hypothetical protein
VILEWGLFAGVLGYSKTIAICEPGTKIPSDLAGLTVIYARRDNGELHQSTLSNIRWKLDSIKNSREERTDNARLLCDRDVVDATLRTRPPQAWFQRSLYYGTHGARGWLDVIGSPAYDSSKTYATNAPLYEKAIDNINARTLVSFGPGDGTPDERLIRRLRLTVPDASYIPVDISFGLLTKAMKRVGHVASSIPVGLLADFEESIGFIRRSLEEHARRPLAICLFGNTIGNLDLGEAPFFDAVCDMLEPGEHLLVEFSYTHENYNLDDDKRASIEGWAPYYDLLAVGIARRAHLTVQEARRDVVERCSVRRGDTFFGDNAVCLTVVDESVGELYSIRRYDFDEFVTHVVSGRPLHFVNSRSGKGRPYADKRGMAVATFVRTESVSDQKR